MCIVCGFRPFSSNDDGVSGSNRFGAHLFVEKGVLRMTPQMWHDIDPFPLLKSLGVEHNAKICSPSMAMVTISYHSAYLDRFDVGHGIGRGLPNGFHMSEIFSSST